MHAQQPPGLSRDYIAIGTFPMAVLPTPTENNAAVAGESPVAYVRSRATPSTLPREGVLGLYRGWWIAPACSADPELCIPVILGVPEWNMIEWCTVRDTP